MLGGSRPPACPRAAMGLCGTVTLAVVLCDKWCSVKGRVQCQGQAVLPHTDLCSVSHPSCAICPFPCAMSTVCHMPHPIAMCHIQHVPSCSCCRVTSHALSRHTGCLMPHHDVPLSTLCQCHVSPPAICHILHCAMCHISQCATVAHRVLLPTYATLCNTTPHAVPCATRCCHPMPPQGPRCCATSQAAHCTPHPTP